MYIQLMSPEHVLPVYLYDPKNDIFFFLKRKKIQ